MKCHYLYLLPLVFWAAACDRVPQASAPAAQTTPAPAAPGVSTADGVATADTRLAEPERALAERERQLREREGALSERERAAEAKLILGERAALDARRRESTRASENGTARPRRAVARGPQTFEIFYDRLGEDGDWIESEQYGFVWQPTVSRNGSWRPYSEGRWAYTDAGWTWVSTERFGWATYHYGRWTRLRDIGWVWVPGEQWAPAWVSWRTSDRYVGWAPLPPEAHFERGRGIHTAADVEYDIGPSQYSFVTVERLGAPSLRRVTIEPNENIVVIRETRNVTNIAVQENVIVNEGPRYDTIRGRLEQPIERMRLERRGEISESAGPSATIVAGAVAVFAPEIRRAERTDRPERVRERVTRVEVDRGWADLRESQTAQQVRARMRAESPEAAQATPFAQTPPATSVPAVEPIRSPSPSRSTAGSTPPAASATSFPTAGPTLPAPSASPTLTSVAPTGIPTSSPTTPSTPVPSARPTTAPPTAAPTPVKVPPTVAPTSTPTRPATLVPTAGPTLPAPSASPTLTTAAPTVAPSSAPTPPATAVPTARPTSALRVTPTPEKVVPTSAPTAAATRVPSPVPTRAPVGVPTVAPTPNPAAPTPAANVTPVPTEPTPTKGVETTPSPTQASLGEPRRLLPRGGETTPTPEPPPGR